MTPYVILYLASGLIAAVSQVMLKKAALKQYDNVIKEYLNPLVIVAYGLFFLTTVLGVLAYKGLPLSVGPVLETINYIYITVFGVLIFKEKLNKRKLMALFLIIIGILVYTLLG
ncbi:MAG: multidrug ABC transporter [Fibrobacter sp.]|nr:multidrug ABC transporter [Fibrobacter sp.]